MHKRVNLSISPPPYRWKNPRRAADPGVPRSKTFLARPPSRPYAAVIIRRAETNGVTNSSRRRGRRRRRAYLGAAAAAARRSTAITRRQLTRTRANRLEIGRTSERELAQR